ncbi:hypothetical protein OAB00_01390 [Akkermansiaceae bacterium]|nr:hypothetical protein [Akkermansiaceae bacterium]
MDMEAFNTSFNQHMVPALKITKEKCKRVCQGTHPKLAEKYRNFANLPEDEQKRMVLSGGI